MDNEPAGRCRSGGGPCRRSAKSTSAESSARRRALPPASRPDRRMLRRRSSATSRNSARRGARRARKRSRLRVQRYLGLGPGSCQARARGTRSTRHLRLPRADGRQRRRPAAGPADLADRAARRSSCWPRPACRRACSRSSSGPAPTSATRSSSSADYVCYTGSTATGRQVAQVAARRLVGVSLELGGKNTMYVAADAEPRPGGRGRGAGLLLRRRPALRLDGAAGRARGGRRPVPRALPRPGPGDAPRRRPGLVAPTWARCCRRPSWPRSPGTSRTQRPRAQRFWPAAGPARTSARCSTSRRCWTA